MESENEVLSQSPQVIPPQVQEEYNIVPEINNLQQNNEIVNNEDVENNQADIIEINETDSSNLELLPPPNETPSTPCSTKKRKR